MTQLLTYAIATNPNPLQYGPSTASLTIVISNNTAGPVYCRQIQCSIPIGTSAQDLTVDAGSIVAAISPAAWSIEADGDNGFLITPAKGSEGILTTRALVVTLEGIPVNKQPGTVFLEIAETTSADKGKFSVRSGQYALAKFPPPVAPKGA